MATETIGKLKTVSVTKIIVTGGLYSAEDVVSNSTSAGTAWTFSAIARQEGAGGYITKVHVMSETTAIAPRFELYLFTDTPTCALNDNAPNTALLWADLANYVGKVTLPAMEDLGTGKTEAVATPSTVGSLPLAFTCASTSKVLYGVLVTRDAFTQTAGDDIVVRVTAEQY